MFEISFTKEECKAALIQLIARLDSLKEEQIRAGKEGRINRVLEIEEFIKPIISFKEKIEKQLYK